MKCVYAFDDAGYVLGALPPDDRQRYVAHMAECPDCRSSVRELAGLPGLLARVDPGDVAGLGRIPEPAPPTILPRMLRVVATDRFRQRRRRTYAFAVAACVAVLSMAAVPLTVVGLRDRNAAPIAQAPIQKTVAMRAVAGPVPVRAAVGVTDTAWGATVTLRCAYDESASAPKQSYGLYAVVASGDVEQIGSWTVGPGEEIQTTAVTRHHGSELEALEIRRMDGSPVLRADL